MDWEALLDDRIDIIATDHAPHTLKKNNKYLSCPSGAFLWFNIRLPVMFEYFKPMQRFL